MTSQFNSLSILYEKPQDKFLSEDRLKIIRKAEKRKEKEVEGMPEAVQEEEEEEEMEKVDVMPEAGPEENLIDFGDEVDEDPMASFDPLYAEPAQAA